MRSFRITVLAVPNQIPRSVHGLNTIPFRCKREVMRSILMWSNIQVIALVFFPQNTVRLSESFFAPHYEPTSFPLHVLPVSRHPQRADRPTSCSQRAIDTRPSRCYFGCRRFLTAHCRFTSPLGHVRTLANASLLRTTLTTPHLASTPLPDGLSQNMSYDRSRL